MKAMVAEQAEKMKAMVAEQGKMVAEQAEKIKAQDEKIAQLSQVPSGIPSSFQFALFLTCFIVVASSLPTSPQKMMDKLRKDNGLSFVISLFTRSLLEHYVDFVFQSHHCQQVCRTVTDRLRHLARCPHAFSTDMVKRPSATDLASLYTELSTPFHPQTTVIFVNK